MAVEKHDSSGNAGCSRRIVGFIGITAFIALCVSVVTLVMLFTLVREGPTKMGMFNKYKKLQDKNRDQVPAGAIFSPPSLPPWEAF